MAAGLIRITGEVTVEWEVEVEVEDVNLWTDEDTEAIAEIIRFDTNLPSEVEVDAEAYVGRAFPTYLGSDVEGVDWEAEDEDY